MTHPEHIEYVRWRIVETLGMRTAAMCRTLLVMTPEKLDEIAEAAIAATREWAMSNREL